MKINQANARAILDKASQISDETYARMEMQMKDPTASDDDIEVAISQAGGAHAYLRDTDFQYLRNYVSNNGYGTTTGFDLKTGGQRCAIRHRADDKHIFDVVENTPKLHNNGMKGGFNSTSKLASRKALILAKRLIISGALPRPASIRKRGRPKGSVDKTPRIRKASNGGAASTAADWALYGKLKKYYLSGIASSQFSLMWIKMTDDKWEPNEIIPHPATKRALKDEWALNGVTVPRPVISGVVTRAAVERLVDALLDDWAPVHHATSLAGQIEGLGDGVTDDGDGM
jgi:hypothetical protein